MELQKPLLSSNSETLLTSAHARLAHAILITGELVGNAQQVSAWYTATLMRDNKGSSRIDIDPQNRGIEAVREINVITSMKQTGRLIVHIAQVDSLSIEAQNALLKKIEEPTSNICFVLSSNQSQKILPTIQSRCWVIPLQKPNELEIQDYFSDADDEKLLGAIVAANGNVHRVQAVLQDPSTATLAKTLAAYPIAKRLAHLSELSSNRQVAEDVTIYMQNIAHFLMHKQPTQYKTHLKRLDLCQETLRGFAANGQPKLLLLRLLSQY